MWIGQKVYCTADEYQADYANLVIGENIEKVHPSDVAVGDVIAVKPSEKVPLDGGVVVRGNQIWILRL